MHMYSQSTQQTDAKKSKISDSEVPSNYKTTDQNETTSDDTKPGQPASESKVRYLF